MTVLAIDPGTDRSAWVCFSGITLMGRGLEDNTRVLERVYAARAQGLPGRPSHLAVEMIASYGMAVGHEVFRTCLWIGRFVEAWSGPHTLIYRQDVKLHLCKDSRARDANVRQALIDRFGPGKDKAIGTVKRPGPLHGVSNDVWSALAIAVTFSDRQTT